MNLHFFILGLSCVFCQNAVVLGGNWPQFRGPTGQGHAVARHLPNEWSPSKNVLWKQAIPGLGWSSPVLQDGRIYLTTAVSEASKLSLQALCLQEESGRVNWQTEVLAPDEAKRSAIHNKNSHASPTPILESNRLYVHFGQYGTGCLDLDGKVIWRSTALPYAPVHGNGGSPILVDDLLLFSADGERDPFVAALDKSTGQVRWKVNRNSDAARTFSFSTPLIITVGGRKQCISPGSNMVGAYEPETGREIWRVQYDGYSVVPRPVFGHGLIFLSTGFDRPSLLAIRPDGQGDVTTSHSAWKTTRGAPNTPSPLLVGDELYVVSDAGIASCLDARTGQLHWQERVGGNCSASPVFADGKIYLQTESGDGLVLQPGRDFRIMAKNSVGERTLASYAVGAETLFIRSEHHLFCIKDLER